ncbi:hypothetical protein GCM10023220_54140 [Streptomyces ziwulingensis]|uniref:Uncharacterized protein n=1 Tax=Streptomyces ziwulingensis TaxID=1045501 RepID=A0ABP9CRW0_9ACTN
MCPAVSCPWASTATAVDGSTLRINGSRPVLPGRPAFSSVDVTPAPFRAYGTYSAGRAACAAVRGRTLKRSHAGGGRQGRPAGSRRAPRRSVTRALHGAASVPL